MLGPSAALAREHGHAPPPAALQAACGVPSPASDASPNSSSGAPPARLAERPKSAKRKAAEAALQRRFSSPSLPALAGASLGHDAPAAKRQRGDPQQQQQRPPVHVAACSDCCHGHSHAGDSGAAEAPAEPWCAQDVALPPMDWAAAMQAVEGDAGVRLSSIGGQGSRYRLPGGISVHVVSRLDQLEPALRALRDSMQDSCVAIDLEWRPEGWAGGPKTPSNVALMQLASAKVAVLVRICQLGYRMPPPLRQFLSDPDFTFVGFSWDGSDEGKMQRTFGAGRSLFARFVDVQRVGEALGYHGMGLAGLAARVLGFSPPKNRKVTMSNWEARALSAKQVQYAALDAVVTGHLFRGLRLWHASPSACTACRQLLGAAIPKPEWRCLDCDRNFSGKGALQNHQAGKGHRVSPGHCEECGRICGGKPSAGGAD